MLLNVHKLESKDVLRFLRENTGLTQEQFAKSIGKTRDWQASNEIGRSRYFVDDLIKIAKKYNLEIIIREKQK